MQLIDVGLLFSLSGTMAVSERGQYQAVMHGIDEINRYSDQTGFRFVPHFKDTCSDLMSPIK